MTEEQIRANDIAQLKGSSIWLTALLLVEEGYVLSKREFFDAIYLRYRWQLKRLPSHCVCGKPFTVDHTLSCLKGGFIHRCHDEIRDLLAATINEVAYDVSIEPLLTPLSGEILPSSANTADDARVDIAARDVKRSGRDVKRHSLMSGYSTHTPLHTETRPSPVRSTTTRKRSSTTMRGLSGSNKDHLHRLCSAPLAAVPGRHSIL